MINFMNNLLFFGNQTYKNRKQMLIRAQFSKISKILKIEIFWATVMEINIFMSYKKSYWRYVTLIKYSLNASVHGKFFWIISWSNTCSNVLVLQLIVSKYFDHSFVHIMISKIKIIGITFNNQLCIGLNFELLVFLYLNVNANVLKLFSASMLSLAI